MFFFFFVVVHFALYSKVLVLYCRFRKEGVRINIIKGGNFLPKLRRIRNKYNRTESSCTLKIFNVIQSNRRRTHPSSRETVSAKQSKKILLRKVKI